MKIFCIIFFSFIVVVQKKLNSKWKKKGKIHFYFSLEKKMKNFCLECGDQVN